MTGIDVSGFQGHTLPAGNWDFVCVKLTEGTWLSNPNATPQWNYAAHTDRGFYHYARPLKSDGETQGNLFAAEALKRGFKPNHDFWALDCEDGLNDNVSPLQWQHFITAFMQAATHKLGNRGLLYAGWYFVQAKQILPAIQTHPWWIPAYGANDGAVHPLPAGCPSNLVVVHQFTSAGGLDKSQIVSAAKFHPAPEVVSVPTSPVARPVLKLGDKDGQVGPLQAKLNTVVNPHIAVDGVFGPSTDHAVRQFQAQLHLNVDGVVGPVTWAHLDYVAALHGVR